MPFKGEETDFRRIRNLGQNYIVSGEFMEQNQIDLLSKTSLPSLCRAYIFPFRDDYWNENMRRNDTCRSNDSQEHRSTRWAR